MSDSRRPHRLALHWKILIGLALGVAAGLALNLWWSAETWSALGVGSSRDYLAGRASEANAGAGAGAAVVRLLIQLNGFVGDLFVRLLRFIAVPIVFFSLVMGAASLGDFRKLGRVGGKTIGIYLITTVAAVALGLLLANVVRPGEYVSVEVRDRLAAEAQAQAGSMVSRTGEVPSAWQQVLDLVPSNPFAALAHDSALHVRVGDARHALQGQPGMLQVIIFALALGVGLSLLPRERGDPAIAVFGALTDAMIKIVHGVLWIAPVAVFALIARVVAAMGLDVLGALAAYSGVVLGGLALLLLVEYPLLVRLVAGIGFVRFFRAMAPAQALAFSSSSSAATLPVTIDCVTNRLGVSKPIASFVCPTGATINMDGTGLHQAASALFIAQMYSIPLPIWAQVGILLTAVLASIGAPGIPSGGIVMLVVVLEQAGFPPAAIAGGIAVILGVDRPLDMCRTVINVTGDATTAAIVARTEGELRPPEEADRLAA
ncbi:MAG: dicarboxylate/amino acid:cation symporter [Phycisphaerales bacterium]